MVGLNYLATGLNVLAMWVAGGRAWWRIYWYRPAGVGFFQVFFSTFTLRVVFWSSILYFLIGSSSFLMIFYECNDRWLESRVLVRGAMASVAMYVTFWLTPQILSVEFTDQQTLTNLAEAIAKETSQPARTLREAVERLRRVERIVNSQRTQRPSEDDS